MGLAMLALNPLAEVAHTALINLKINAPINQIYRFALLLVLLSNITSKRRRKLVTVFALALCGTSVFRLISISSVNIVDDISFSIKIFSIPVIIFGLQEAFDNSRISLEYIRNTFVISGLFIALNVALSPVGPIVNGLVRRTGLFAFGNYLVVPLAVTEYLSFYYRKKYKYIIFTIGTIALLLLGNRFGYIAAILSVLILIRDIIRTMSYRQILYKVMPFALIALLICISPFILNFINNQLEIYTSYNYTNIFSYLLSNRDMQVLGVIEYIELSGISPIIVLLFGLGDSTVCTVVNAVKYEFQSLEMDLPALLFANGLVGVSVGIITLGSIVRELFIRRKNLGDKFAPATIVLIVILIQSMLGGHVLTESLVLPFIAAFYVLITRQVSSEYA